MRGCTQLTQEERYQIYILKKPNIARQRFRSPNIRPRLITSARPPPQHHISGSLFARGELTQLAHTLAQRIGRYLERQGWLEHDAENDYLALDTGDGDPLSVLQGHSISYRIGLGPQAGRKVFTLQTLSPVNIDDTHTGTVGQVAGFNLHAGVAARADERRKLERLCRYIARPAVSEQRLSLTAQGKVRYRLKTPYADGTTHVIFEPLDFISRLAALVPKPRVN